MARTHDIDIVQAGAVHVTAIAMLLGEVRRWLLSQGNRQWPEPLTLEWIARAVARQEFYLALRQGELVGVFRLLWRDAETWGEMPDDAGYVHTLAVQRDQAGQQIGATMLGWAEATVARQGKRYLRLDCVAENPRLVEYYAAAGYRPVRQIEHDGGHLQLFEKRVGLKQ